MQQSRSNSNSRPGNNRRRGAAPLRSAGNFRPGAPNRSHGPAPAPQRSPEPAAAHAAPVLPTESPIGCFRAMGLADPILRALRDEGYDTPTPIQGAGIAPTLAGRDVLGCAQTGTGKTAAFALPILHRLHSQAPDKSRRGPTLPRALVLCPTRELAAQIGVSLGAYGRHTGLRHAVIFGGVSQSRQERALRDGVDILVATPGRLIDLMEQGVVNLSAVRIFVLDEADRMLDMGFIQPIRRIAGAITTDRQTLLFSATMPPTIQKLAGTLLRDPVRVSVAPAARETGLIEESVYMAPQKSKQALLERLLTDDGISRALVFTRTKHGAERVTKKLRGAGVGADSIHGNKNQNQRERALAGFRTGRSRVLVATDVAARGLDVDGITHVINFDLPVEPEAYVHRIGRTGRAGAKGVAIAFCDNAERDLLRAIERLTGQRVRIEPTPTDLPQPVREVVLDEPRRQPAPAARGRSHASPPARRGEPHRGAFAGAGGRAGGKQRSQTRRSRG